MRGTSKTRRELFKSNYTGNTHSDTTEDVKNSSRFATCEEKDLNELVSSANAKGTKRNTKWVLKLLQEWCHERKICKPLLDLTEAELNDILRRFYAEARNQKGEEYSRSSLLGFRNAVERHFAVNGKAMKLTSNPAFYSSNKILESKLKVNKREQKQNTKHKLVIEPADVSKVKKNPFLSHENPYGLLRRVWFIVTLYWCRRGCEGQRQLRRESFTFDLDGEGKEYATMTHEEQTKNHQGGFCDKQSYENETRLYSTGETGDSLWCLKYYLSKLNPKQQTFFQRPVPIFTPEDPVWYENKPLGVNNTTVKIQNGGMKIRPGYSFFS
ncbi:uncharacterized protein LOC116309046 [Actinia tenebrosa]|uniref:Uncharacterized protein LOC116309046 n=1 Tax=Actinia tenebrosa TaxID=6105 RepID=A0A6P8J6L1_ACTTE|nr:uncharacterized protein LOC116309046 [Actinia tenebrosa]